MPTPKYNIPLGSNPDGTDYAATKMVGIYKMPDGSTYKYDKKGEVDLTNVVVDENGLAVRTNISEEEGNIIEKKDDGIYSPTPEIPTPADFGVLEVRKQPDNAIALNTSDAQRPVIGLTIKENGGNVTLTQDDNGLAANVDLKDLTIEADQVIGLHEDIIDVVTGRGTGKLNIERNAQVNKLEGVAIPGAILRIDSNKRVTIPYATKTSSGSTVTRSAGLVRGADGLNQVDFENGIGTVNSLSTDKLEQGSLPLMINGGLTNVNY